MITKWLDSASKRANHLHGKTRAERETETRLLSIANGKRLLAQVKLTRRCNRARSGTEIQSGGHPPADTGPMVVAECRAVWASGSKSEFGLQTIAATHKISPDVLSFGPLPVHEE